MPGTLRRLVPTLLRGNRPFRRYWVGQTVSMFGDQISLIALPLVGVLVLRAGPAQMGYLMAAGLIPNLLFSLPAGAWVDRLGRRRQMMLAADVGRALLLATVPIAAALGVLGLPQLYAVAFLVGSLSVVFFVSQGTLFTSLVPRDRFMEGNQLVYGSRAFSFVGGPSVGGILVQLLTAPMALGADAVSFLASAFALSRIRPAEAPAADGSRRLLTDGAKFIWRSPVVRAALAATATINLFNFIFRALFILYATRELRIRPGTLGVILGAGAVGGLLGAVVSGRVSRRIGVGATFLAGCVLFPAPLILVPFAAGPPVLVLSMLFASSFGAGLGVMVLDISIASIFAAVIPEQMRARVSGAYMLVNYGVRPLGSLAGGALGSALGLRSTLLIAAVGAVAGFIWLLPSPIPRLRALPAEPDDLSPAPA